jgi:hypothetical protein
MTAKLALSLAAAAVILAVGGFVGVFLRLDRIEARLPAPKPPAHEGRPPGVVPPAKDQDPFESKDPLVKLDAVLQRLDDMSKTDYDTYSDLSQDLYELKKEVRQLKSTLRQIVQGIGRGDGGSLNVGWGLAPAGKPIDEATVQAYREAAEKQGIKVEDGRVEVRGFLNLSPRRDMPIEYFITRYPELGYETLVHLIGKASMDDLQGNPYGALKGLATGLYKGMVAAGFRPGMPTHPVPGSDPQHPQWVLASGDVVYVGVRYEHDGKTNLALATDWVLDPTTGKVLPPDAFRFTGSLRGEDPDTGDETLSAESSGLLVSVWPNGNALIEVALESAWKNDYAYNFARIPAVEKDKILYLDLVFSRTPIEPEGEGAAPIDRPPPIGAKDTSPAPEHDKGAGSGR